MAGKATRSIEDDAVVSLREFLQGNIPEGESKEKTIEQIITIFKKARKTEETNKTSLQRLAAGLVFFVLLIAVIFSEKSIPTESSSNGKSTVNPYPENFEQFKAAFSISGRREIMVNNIWKRWAVNNEPAPTVVTVAGSGSQDFIDAFLHVADEAAGRNDAHRGFSSADLKGWERENIVDEIKKIVRGKKKPVVALFDIDKLEWDAPMVFFSFADDRSYKKNSHSNLLLLLSVDAEVDKKNCEAELSRILEEKWLASGGTMRVIEPLISRILQFSVCL